MPARRMRVELFDTEGNKYTVAFEGQMTREKALRLLDLVELLGGVPSVTANSNSTAGLPSNESSKYEKVQIIIRKSFPIVWFSSREVQGVFEQEFKEPVSLSTISTYLARMATKGILLRNGAANSLKYKVAPGIPQATIKQKML